MLMRKRLLELSYESGCATRQHQSVYRISLLPNELLVCSLCLLSFKEAARTSALSKRWIRVWTHVPRLDFGDFMALHEITMLESMGTEPEKFVRKKRRKFVVWVNKVLQSHKARVLDEFRVYFHLDNSFQKVIDKWVKYAFVRKVQRLELNLVGELSSMNPYAFSFISLHWTTNHLFYFIFWLNKVNVCKSCKVFLACVDFLNS